MSFPAWAPAILVSEYEKLRGRAEQYRQRSADDGRDELSDSFGHHQVILELEATKFEELAEILLRLLTWKDMEAAWGSLSRPCANQRVLRYCKDWERTGPYLLWDFVARSVVDFQRQQSRLQTPAYKRKSLVSIANKLKGLMAEIANDPTANEVAFGFIPMHMSLINLKFRQDIGDTPSEAEFVMPLTMQSDLYEARALHQEIDEFTDVRRWKEQPLVSRLAYWVSEIGNTPFLELLESFAGIIEAEADSPPEIKQPGRSEEAIKPFLVRRVNECVRWFYGQPLDDAVARIVTAALDLDTPLTRDDVRPYTRQTGKKLNV